jgi:hypothetical protein
MKYPMIPYPRERDQVIMEIILNSIFSTTLQSLNWCRVRLQCIFLSDMVTDDGKYLENFVFNPGLAKCRSHHCFPQECPRQQDWNTWFDFWHTYTLQQVTN